MCGVMKLINLLFAKGRKYGNMFSQENLSFSTFEVAFCMGRFASDTCGNYLNCLIPNAAGNYKLCVLMHAGMK